MRNRVQKKLASLMKTSKAAAATTLQFEIAWKTIPLYIIIVYYFFHSREAITSEKPNIFFRHLGKKTTELRTSLSSKEVPNGT
jgi:hypothetical protein